MKKLVYLIVATILVPSSAFAFTFSRTLTVGSTGDEVTKLQQVLVQQGLLSVSPTGYFGPLTQEAVNEFQAAHNLSPAGQVGPLTRALLNSMPVSQAGSGTAATQATQAIQTAQANQATQTNEGTVLSQQLAVGSTGTDVLTLQAFLAAEGFFTQTPTGYYGPVTEAAVQSFQAAHSLESVGNVGPKTLALIDSLLSSSHGGEGNSSSGGHTAANGSTNTTTTGVATFPIKPNTSATIVNFIPTGASRDGSNNSGGEGGGNANPGGTTVLSTPGTLTVATPSSTEVDLSWSASTGNVNVPTYIVTRNGVPIATPNSTSFQDTNLSPNTQYIYTVRAVDAAGDVSAALGTAITTPQAPVSDMTPPTLSNIQPSGTLPAGTTQTTLSLTTSKAATCAYATTNLAFSLMAPFSSTGGTSHSVSLSGLTNGSSYLYFLACKDAAGNMSPTVSTTLSVATPASPVVTFSASPMTITAGNSSTLTWSSTNATSCTASNGWSGSESTSGMQSVSPSATATYRLDCTGAGGSANESVTITVNPAPDTTAPSAPTNLSGSAISTTQVNLTWSASADNVGVTGYKVFRNGTQVGTPATTGYSDSGLTASTQYTYTVKATDAAGNLSAASNSATVTTQAPADTTPPSIAITAPSTNLVANTTSTTLAVTTNENATCRYSTVSAFTFSSGTVFSTTGGTSHTMTISGLANSTSYTYYVKCQDTSGNTSGNASVTFAVATPVDTTAPSVPTNLSASAVSSSQINLSWSASTDNVGVTGYNVFRNGTKVGTSVTNSYSDSGLTASTAYSYTVSAFDAAGNASAQSSVVSVTTRTASTPTLSTNITTVAPGAPITATLSNGTTGGWIGFYPTGQAFDYSVSRQNVTSANQTFNFSAVTSTNTPAPAGTYNFRVYDANNNLVATSPNITVTAAASDTQAPSIPTGLSATAVSSSQINLSWSASTDNVGVTGYNIFRNGTKIGTSATNSYSDSGLTASTEYSYTVAAYDAAGNTSAQSASVSMITSSVSSSIAVGSSIVTTVELNVRQSPSPDATNVGSVPSGTFGTVIGGPTIASGYTWWQVNYATGISGWSIGNYLVPASPTTTSSPTFGSALPNPSQKATLFAQIQA